MHGCLDGDQHEEPGGDSARNLGDVPSDCYVMTLVPSHQPAPNHGAGIIEAAPLGRAPTRPSTSVAWPPSALAATLTNDAHSCSPAY
jgi:hypothetical protein